MAISEGQVPLGVGVHVAVHDPDLAASACALRELPDTTPVISAEPNAEAPVLFTTVLICEVEGVEVAVDDEDK